MLPLIELVPLQPEHVRCFYHWLRNPAVIAYSLSVFQNLQTDAQIDDWFAATLQDQKSLTRGIYLPQTQELIGYAGLTNISRLNHSAEFFLLLGEQAYWGRGIGTAVTRLVLELGFTTQPLHRIMLTVSEPNQGGVRAYRKAGFREEGRLREACCRQGHYHDKLVMSVLESEWQALNQA